MEPPSPSSSRARTPHHQMLHPNNGVFPPPMSPRCLQAEHVSGLGLIPSINTNPSASNKVNTAVQTDKDKENKHTSAGDNRRHCIPNLSLARSVTHHNPSNSKVHQSTSTHDLIVDDSSSSQTVDKSNSNLNKNNSYNKSWKYNKSLSPPISDHLSPLDAITSSLTNYELNQSGNLMDQLSDLTQKEGQLLKHLELLQQEANLIAQQRQKITTELGRLHSLRAEKLSQIVKNECNGEKNSETVSCMEDSTKTNKKDDDQEMDAVSSVQERNPSPSKPTLAEGHSSVPPDNSSNVVSSLADNSSVVSSSQETFGLRVRSFNYTNSSPNDSSSESQSGRRQRCTSTSHSPSINSKSYDNNDNYYSVENPEGENFYKRVNDRLANNSNSNSDSEPDDVRPKSSSNSVSHRASSSCRKLEESAKLGKHSKRRRRDSSISSSGGADAEESDTNIEKEDREEVEMSSIRHSISSNEEVPVVESTQPFDCTNSQEVEQEEPPESRPITPNAENFNVLEESETKVSNTCTSSYNPKMISNQSPRLSDDIQEVSLESRRKSLSLSPHSPKTRNSSGSEHNYSLRSKGPPCEVVDSDSQQSKDTFSCNFESIKDMDLCTSQSKADDGHADDELEKDEEEKSSRSIKDMKELIEDNRKKRKRKSKYRGTRGGKKRKWSTEKFKLKSSSLHLKSQNNLHNESGVKTNSLKSSTSTNKKSDNKRKKYSNAKFKLNSSSVKLKGKSKSIKEINIEVGADLDTTIEISDDENCTEDVFQSGDDNQKYFTSIPTHDASVLDIKVDFKI